MRACWSKAGYMLQTWRIWLSDANHNTGIMGEGNEFKRVADLRRSVDCSDTRVKSLREEIRRFDRPRIAAFLYFFLLCAFATATRKMATFQ